MNESVVHVYGEIFLTTLCKTNIWMEKLKNKKWRRWNGIQGLCLVKITQQQKKVEPAETRKNGDKRNSHWKSMFEFGEIFADFVRRTICMLHLHFH